MDHRDPGASQALIGWLLLTASLWITTVESARKQVASASTIPFEFTRPSYNVSIEENARSKSFLQPDWHMGIAIHHPSLNVRYRVINGDPDKFFKAEERQVGDFYFLLLRTRSGLHKVINRERQDLYVLTVKAVAKSRNYQTLTTHAKIYVHVLDANDLSPLFYPTTYSVEVREDTPLHISITRVTAEDADIGVNGDIYYSFKDPTPVFSIHPTSGVISLTRPLSHIEQNYYDVDIIAVDRGQKFGYASRVSIAHLQVGVIAVNYHAPKVVLQELPAVLENVGVGTIYAILYVHDKDIGDNGEIGSVRIADGNQENYFKLESAGSTTKYNLKVAKLLDREVLPSIFNLTVAATDGGTPPRTTETLVQVQLADMNDEAPEFEQELYRAQVDEVAPVHTPLVLVKALDKDSGGNGDVVYDIAQGNDRGWFSIDRMTGLVSVAGPLDAEITSLVQLVIGAQDRANAGSRQASYTQLHISIQDCNDNVPMFNETWLVAYVSEDVAVGTDVQQVAAYDLDTSDNGYLSYSLSNPDPMPFNIDHFTGMIRTSQPLDYESMKRLYKLRVRVSDWGSPFRRESETEVHIKLRDANDNKPIFEKVNCTGYLSREAPIATTLVVVSAIDFDAGNIISYQILSGNADGCFTMDASQGVLSLGCDLSEDNVLERSLLITATDGHNSADPMSVNITLVNNNHAQQLSSAEAKFACQNTGVTDQLSELLQIAELNHEATQVDLAPSNTFYSLNSHVPIFSDEMPLLLEVPEDQPVGQSVLTAAATDADPGFSGRLLYVISDGNQGGVFQIDTYTGMLMLLNEVDRESRDEYDLNITVTDMGVPPRASYTLLSVMITDVNDFAPEFERSYYSVTISEGEEIGATILQVLATDRDLGRNAEISYFIVTDTQEFTIDRNDGTISVNNRLDREQQPVYELLVEARDKSQEHPLSAQVRVTVHLEDVNDNIPLFTPTVYQVRIREDLPIGSVVMIITAQDPDLKGGGTVRYSLQDGTADKFQVDRDTGTIRIAANLDYETQQIYNITARARDRGEPSLTSVCQVIVEIIDVDENLFSPEFDDFIYEAHVEETALVNTTVLQLTALDRDADNILASSKDYDVVYSIRNGSGLGVFSIDKTGVIRTSQVLDRESQAHYWLTVYAQDRGSVPRSAFVEVYVAVDDVNDNLPQPLEPVYYADIPENSPANTTIVVIEAVDRDEASNSHLTFYITGGNPQGFFAINTETGVITTTERILDREKQDEHILEVTISDNGASPLNTPNLSGVTTRVVINITDENDVAPTFTERSYRVRLPAMGPSDTDVELYRVVARDPDSGDNADVDYSINKAGKSGGRFKIHPKTGMITSQKTFEAGQQYDVTVKATDNGRPQLRSSAHVVFDVVQIPTESDNPPVFVETYRSVSVTENDGIGRLVAILIAEDPNEDILWYSITAGNEDQKFSMHNIEEGNIVIAGLLDWETTREYNLTVQATDGVHSATAMLHIQVLDINDNRPEFTESRYTISINENTAPGTDILTVMATDLDEDKRLFYTIQSAADTTSLARFKINSETDEEGRWTGVITTTAPLNREAITEHELTIMVRDGGLPSRRSLARVLILIADHNDHAPVFLWDDLEGRVFETAAMGTAVLQVKAVDKDVGTNAELQYSILAGNIGNAFSIDSTLGYISVARPLDRETQQAYSLVVRAADGGSPSLTSTTEVRIFVTISNNAPPSFSMVEYMAELSENAAENSYVTAVVASSRSSVIYEITDGNQGGFFKINPNSGVVSTEIMVDYEVTSFFNITVLATNMVGVSSQTTVLVHVIDENDNRPVFVHSEYVGNVSELAAANCVVLDSSNTPLVVKAEDVDSGQNALLMYSIEEEQDIFDIDPTTGAIRTAAVLDHEVQAIYMFHVQVQDLGQPSQSAEVAATVWIYITDINDSPPIFEESSYEGSLLLPTYSGVQVMQVHADDADSNSVNQLSYSITSGDPQHHFAIDPATGALSVRDSSSMASQYQMTVSVSDGLHEGQTEVNIAISETLSSGLHFSEEVYDTTITENQTAIHQVAIVEVRGHALNEHLTFRLLNPSDLFQIGATSGVVQTTGTAFDREAQEDYTLIVAVQDQREPPRVAHCVLNVHVEDLNDNAPMFVNQPYYAIVSVDAEAGSTVKQVIAMDQDTGANGEVEYNLLEDADGRFSIHPLTGAIIIQALLEADDQNKEFMLLVEASDKGDPALSTRVHVPVRIMNRATPIFSQQVYSASVAENAPMHTTITSIEAHSPTGQKLIYSIMGGDPYNEFDVLFNTAMDVLGPCALTLLEELDYELRQEYELMIRATDTLTGSFAEVLVMIQLEDQNDNPPSFDNLYYTTAVNEAAAIGTSILVVTASDQDSSPNAQLRYQLSGIDDAVGHSRYFHIDPEKGIIFTKHPLDHETQKELRFNVIATDSGVPTLNSTAEVKVIVLDLNDNAPSFEQPSYEVTITDLVSRNQFIMSVSASDADSSDGTNLAYSIVGGNERQTFTMDEYTGILMLSNHRQAVLSQEYRLNVSVTDGVFTNFARVHITVRTSNLFAPTFPRALYQVEVPENLLAGQSVLTVVAEDEDEGRYGNIKYVIASEDAEELFHIDANTGELTTSGPLDRESQAVHDIPITAIDGGSRSGYTVVRVTVTDQADHQPKFLWRDYQANIYAHVEENTFVLEVVAHDPDLGMNSDLTYNLVESDEPSLRASDYLIVEAKSGIIRTHSDIQMIENEFLQFFVRVADKGIPPQEMAVGVQVYIMSDDATPPVFEQDIYTFFLPEDSPTSSVIATVTAQSNDSLVYSIVPGSLPHTNNPMKFSIDQSGTISVVEALDRETTETFKLLVKAETRTSPALVGFTHVTVQVMDVNDNPPQFESHPYRVSIVESAETGSSVLQVRASDQDTGANADVRYTFAQDYTHFSNIFNIDPQTGWITTLVSLDREAQSNYTFDVVAQDRGAHTQLSDTTQVIVMVADFNDEEPEFQESLYQGAVNEDALPGTIILSVQTVDRDLGENAQVTYYIASGDRLGQFSIRPTGEIYVNKPLDREQKSVFKLSVAATDGAYVSMASVQITILDANDNHPICDQPIYEAIVTEDVPIGSFVVRVSATDADEAGTRNARIRYEIADNEDNMFVMHRKSGIISTREALDRETVPRYHLVVLAVDGGELSCSMDVYITLTDVNDIQPVFSQSIYNVSILESAEVNTILTRVSSVDNDLGINRKVRYAIQESDGHFTIDPLSGVVSLTEMVDREAKALYNLTLYAYDQGTPKLTSTSKLVVRVLDVNDNPPIFEMATYSETVSEDTSSGTSVLRVLATSRDIGINAEISYALVSGNEQGQFGIHPESGVVYVSQPLDYEANKEYILSVMATDGGDPALSNTAVVHINMSDINDNSPVFASQTYDVSVRENAPIETELVEVHAMDVDDGINAEMVYRIIDGDPSGYFAVGATDGHISLAASLDREQEDFYSLTIEASDLGDPPLTGTVVVMVTVTDTNDCPPVFVLDNYTAVVQVDEQGYVSRYKHENSEVGFRLLQVEVTDADLPPNGAPFTFDIIDGNANAEFRIDRQGVLTTTARFDRDIKDEFDLTIRAIDNGASAMYSDVHVTVKIIEESAFKPTVEALRIQVMAFDEEFPGGELGQVEAYDRDIYDTITYAIASDNRHLFNVDELNGKLTAVQALDVGVYHINMSVSDGKFVTYGLVELEIRGIDDDMAGSSVVVRFSAVMPEEFYRVHRDEFVQVIQQNLGVPAEQVLILSVQSAGQSTVAARRRRGADNDLDVLVAVKKSSNGYYRGNTLRRRVQQMIPELESVTGLQVDKVFNDICAKDTCDSFSYCRTEAEFLNEIDTIVIDGKSYVSPAYNLVTKCLCRNEYGVYPNCEEEVTSACLPNPCRPPNICHLQGSLGYKCDCPEGKTGSNCDIDITEPCTEPRCTDVTPLSFSGHSYAKWRLTNPMERRFGMSLEIRTTQQEARLMHAVGRVDYSILEMVNDGFVQYRFDCGSGEGLVRVDSVRINDDQWHIIIVERRGNQAEIIIDNIYSETSSAPGTNAVLNLDSNNVFLGGEVVSLSSGDGDVRNGFEGCLRAIQVLGVSLPHSGSNEVGTFQEFKDVEFTCKTVTIPPGMCGIYYCQNGGSCIPRGPTDFYCKCSKRYTGRQCEIDLEISALSPFCYTNPCKHGGICVSQEQGPVCRCPGYSAPYCEYDIDECQHNPCHNGGLCINTIGSFHCECAEHARGPLCQDVVGSPITSTPFNITIEEIVGIIGVLVVLIIIVIIFVFVVRWRRRKRRSDMSPGNTYIPNDYLSYENLKEHNKMGTLENATLLQNIPPSPRQRPSPHTSPRPPPVPARPASYAQSTADSANTLNNFGDLQYNYGSAGDDLETAGTKIEIPEFLRNLDVEKSPPPRRGVSLNPPPYVDERQRQYNPNYNYPKGDIKQLNKSIPTDDGSSGMLLGDDDQVPAKGPKKKGFFWDASDWSENPLPNITEVPMGEVPDSPLSSRSNDSNLHIHPDEYEYADYPEDSEYPDMDLEYVGDSEFTENECATDDDLDDPEHDLPERPNFEQILAMHGDFDDDGYDPNKDYSRHPNDYMPTYHLDNSLSQGSQDEEMNGNADVFARDDQNDVIHYDSMPRRYMSEAYGMPFSGGYHTNTGVSGLDDMSVSMAGYTSTNASCSDISGLCEIEDSEANLSDNEGGAEIKIENDLNKLSTSHTHTQV